MIITVTERGTFRRCRRQWDYGSFNRRGIVPVLNKPALDLGTLWHAAQADWGANPTADLSAIYIMHASKLLQTTLDRYKTVVGAPISDMELDPLNELILLGKSMCENYQSFWKTPFPPRYTLVAAEQTITVPIPGTECHGTWIDGLEYRCAEVDGEYVILDLNANVVRCPSCSGTGQHCLEATLDGIVQDERGNNFVLERKTYGSRPRIESLQMNDQFLAYLWIMKQLDMEPIGVAYDGAWKRAVPPRGSQMSDLFLRKILVRPIDEIEEFEESLIAEVEDMARPDLRIYKNEMYDCSYMCGYRELCAAQSRGEDYEDLIAHRFVKRERTAAFSSSQDATES